MQTYFANKANYLLYKYQNLPWVVHNVSSISWKWISAGPVEVTRLPPPSSIFHSVLAFSWRSKKGGIVQKWVTTAVSITGHGLIDVGEDNYWSNLKDVWCWWMSFGLQEHLPRQTCSFIIRLLFGFDSDSKFLKIAKNSKTALLSTFYTCNQYLSIRLLQTGFLLKFWHVWRNSDCWPLIWVECAATVLQCCCSTNLMWNQPRLLTRHCVDLTHMPFATDYQILYPL